MDAYINPKTGEVLPILKRTTAKLQVVFTAEVKAAMHEELLDKRDAMSALNAWWEEKKAEKKSREAALVERMDDLHRRLRAGYDTQDVMTVVIPDRNKGGMVQIIRLDTNEVVKTRTGTEDELQVAMDFDNVGPEVTDGVLDGVEPDPASIAAQAILDAVGPEAVCKALDGAGLTVDVKFAQLDELTRMTEEFGGYPELNDTCTPAEVVKPAADEIDLVISALRQRDDQLRRAYFEDADRQTVVDIWRKVTGMVDQGKRKSAKLIAEILDILDHENTRA